MLFGKSDTHQYCAFCGKPDDGTRHLVTNPANNISICDKCIETCKSIVESKERSAPPIDMSEVPTPKEFKDYLEKTNFENGLFWIPEDYGFEN